MQFTLDRTTVKLANVNLRSELHGEEHKPAVDLKLEFAIGNDVLAQFDPALKSSLYRKVGALDAQQDLVAVEGHLPMRLFPRMSPFSWDDKVAGAKVTIHVPSGLRDDIVLEACDVDNFRIECQDRGVVELAFRIKAHPDEKQIGRLASMVQQDVLLSIVPPIVNALAMADADDPAAGAPY